MLLLKAENRGAQASGSSIKYTLHKRATDEKIIVYEMVAINPHLDVNGFTVWTQEASSGRIPWI